MIFGTNNFFINLLIWGAVGGSVYGLILAWEVFTDWKAKRAATKKEKVA